MATAFPGPSVAAVIKMMCSVSGFIWSLLPLVSIFSEGEQDNQRLFLAVVFVQFDQFLDCCRILWLFVSLSEGDQPWKA